MFSHEGDVAFAFDASYELLFTQGLVLELELKAAVQNVPGFGIGSGLNDVSLGGRMRYGVARELAPYVGVVWRGRFGETADMARAAGEAAAHRPVRGRAPRLVLTTAASTRSDGMDGRSWKIVGGTTVALLLILVLGGLAFVYSGAYNVAATEEHTALVRWVLETTQDRSIEARGADVGEAPPFDSAVVVAGFDGFRAMCVECHGAPGVDPDVNGQGLYPEPPELGEEAGEFTDAELFWITKNGIKFTGMPAFGPTHSDEDLWSLVAFLREIEEMTPEEYQQRVTEREAELEARGDETGGHTHAPGTATHDH